MVEKLEGGSRRIRAEGWKWVTITPSISHDHLRGCAGSIPNGNPPTEEQQAELDNLTARYDALIEEHGDERPNGIMSEIEELYDGIDAFRDGTLRWLPEDVAGISRVSQIWCAHSAPRALSTKATRSRSFGCDSPARCIIGAGQVA